MDLDKYTDEELTAFIEERKKKNTLPNIKAQTLILGQVLELLQDLPAYKYEDTDYFRSRKEEALYNYVKKYYEELERDLSYFGGE